MAETLSERLAKGALVLSDTAQIKSQFPEWLRREIEDASQLMSEAAELARNVDRLDVAQCCCGCERAVCNSCGAELGKLMPRVALVEVGDA